MKKFLSLILLTFFVTALIFPVVTRAQFVGSPAEVKQQQSAYDAAAITQTKTNGGSGVALSNPIPGGDIDTLIKNFITAVLGLSGVLALVAFVFGGIYWLISMGDTNKITKGRNIMLWAVLGLVVIFGSYAIISMVYNILGIS